MLFPFYSLIVFCYAALRLLPGLPLTRKSKIAAALFMLLASLYHLISRYLLRSLAAPELPAPVLMIQGWLFFALVLLFAMLLLRDVTLIALWLARRTGLTARLPGSPLRQAGIMISIALVLSAYGVWQGVRPPEARSVEIILPDLPTALDGFTLAHITDPHASALLRGPRVRAMVDTVMAMQPDLIVLSGDLVDGSVERRWRDVAPLADLTAPHGVFSGIGNHEYYSGYNDWMARFAELGFTMLENSHIVIEVNGASLVIAGTTDQVAERFGLPGPDTDAALAGSPENATRILLEHRPGNARENAAKGVHLQLSGHTHGGHFLGFDRIVARFNNGFVSGLYQLDSMQLYVSHGAGLWSGFPVRLGVPSEVTRIVLRAGAR
ncbi:MAG: metallophosphoesterase [Desulfovibrionaceae bacterium]|nr:metallophosphoesterase [Desulfovibrionaceae bacterium]